MYVIVVHFLADIAQCLDQHLLGLGCLEPMETQAVRLFLQLVLITGMLFYTLESIRKFQEHKISRNVYRDTSDREEFRFPSVTVCAAFRNGTATPENIVKAAAENGIEDPMLLSKEAFDGMTYGRHEYLSYFTQAIDNDWSNNLLDDDARWEEQYHEYLGGRCATFNPINTTKPGEINSLAIAIKLPTDRSWYFVSDAVFRNTLKNGHSVNRSHIGKYLANANNFFQGCDVFGVHGCRYLFAAFLHSKDSFIYNKGHKFVGQSFAYPNLDQRTQFILTKQRFIKLNQERDPCNETASLKTFESCVRRVYDERAGCKMPWRTNETNE